MKKWWRCDFCRSWVGNFRTKCNNCGASRVQLGRGFSRPFGGSRRLSGGFLDSVSNSYSYSSCPEDQ